MKRIWPINWDSGDASMPASALLALITAWLAIDQLLLWRFLGWSWLPLAGGLVVAAVLVHRIASSTVIDVRIPLPRFVLCCALALILLMLGGEGRFFYANIDWQVREAVLRDMAIHPWPFVYLEGNGPQLLRAPIGMFLVPALVFKAAGPLAGDMALLAQNGLLSGALLALGSVLFDTKRSRLIAVGTVLFFSGLDLVGTLIFHGGWRDHLEFWFATMQYSSHITQAFWVPQHGFAGWLAAILFLLWHRGRMALWPLLAVLPLTALWSPLALIGAMPFALWAGLSALVERKLTIADIGWPALSVLLAFPGLVYLAAAPDGVGIRPYPLQMLAWLIFVSLELLVYALPLFVALRNDPRQRLLLSIATLWLLIVPFIQIGWSLDFMMRASIPALMILAVMVAQSLADSPSRALRLWLMLMLLVGSVTGLTEIARAFTQPPSPRGQCSFFGAWDVSFGAYPKGSYLAPLDQLPAMIRPADPARIMIRDPSTCWDGPWARPEGV